MSCELHTDTEDLVLNHQGVLSQLPRLRRLNHVKIISIRILFNDAPSIEEVMQQQIRYNIEQR
jgi:hypothetical protein